LYGRYRVPNFGAETLLERLQSLVHDNAHTSKDELKSKVT